jgi:16S rRNA (uracil1498-N3)-methyltransferase
MTIHRFFAPSSFFEKGNVVIRGDEGYHLARILRAKKGQAIRVFNEKGSEFGCVITNIRGTEITAEIQEKITHEVEPNIRVNIVQGLVKPAKMELIIQKCTEIGAVSFTPVSTEYSIAKPNQPDKQLQRWDRIALEAAKQSERRRIPPVHGIMSLEEYLSQDHPGLKLYMDARDGNPPKKTINSAKSAGSVAEIFIAVGPEGGFSPKESSLLSGKGFMPVHLGPRVLRTETAAAVLTAILLYEFGEMG